MIGACRIASLIFVVSLSEYTFGQRIQYNQYEYIGHYVASIRDPENELANAALALNKSVAKEIGLSEEKYEALALLHRECGGSLLSAKKDPEMAAKFRAMLPERRTMADVLAATEYLDFTEMERQHHISVAANAIRLYEILSQEQRDRLVQISHQVEVSRVGLGEAIIDGWLGKYIGVEEYQKPALEIRAKAIQENLDWSIRHLLTDSYQQMFKELELEQRGLCSKLLGEPHILRHVDSSIEISDVENVLTLLKLVNNKTIATELRVSEKEVTELKGFVEYHRGDPSRPIVSRKVNGRRLSNDEWRSKFDQEVQKNLRAVEEILDPIQIERLKQLAYQVEVTRKGFCVSFTDGVLATRLNIAESCKPRLREVGSEIDKRLSSGVKQLESAAQEDLLRELTPLQSKVAKQRLGPPIDFKEE